MQCTPGGGGPHVQTSLEHNSCMQEESPEVGGATREEEPTTFAYRMTQATYSTHLVNNTGVIYLYGAEYETRDGPLSVFNNQNAPCAVCYVSTRGTVLMIPGKTTCPSSWTQEYNGYLMTERYKNHHSMFECVDQNPDTVRGGTGSIDGALFYFVEATCHGIACPPYTAGRKLACAVCTK